METRSIEFPISPKDRIDSTIEKYGCESLEFAWNVLLSAAAQADRRTLKTTPENEHGSHTTIVHELIEPFESDTILPAAIGEFKLYIYGNVLPRWGERYYHDNLSRKNKYFVYKARVETIELAELKPEVQDLFIEGYDHLECRTYFNQLSEGVKSLAPDDDFPYRNFKKPGEKEQYWDYLVNGTDKQPGMLATAVALEQQSANIDKLLRSVFGPSVDIILARHMLDLVTHLRTSNRRSNETERGIITPLLQSFNSSNLGMVRTTLRDFAQERPEFVPLGFDKDLVLDRAAIAHNQRHEQAVEKAANKHQLSDEYSKLANSLGNLDKSNDNFNQSDVDPATNSYVARNRWRTYRRGNERLVLVDAGDSQKMDRKTQIYAPSPRLRFLKYADIDNGSNYEVKETRIYAKDFFKKIRSRDIEELSVNIDNLKKIAIHYGDQSPIARGIVKFIQSLEDNQN